MHLSHIPQYTILEQKGAHFCFNEMYCGVYKWICGCGKLAYSMITIVQRIPHPRAYLLNYHSTKPDFIKTIWKLKRYKSVTAASWEN